MATNGGAAVDPNEQGKAFAEQVAKAFVEAYYAALDKQDKAQLPNFFQDASTLSFEGEMLKGKTAISNKLTSLGLPAQVQRRVTATDAQKSVLGSNAVIVFITGEWMGQQYQEMYQLVPIGDGQNYYIHNCIFRFGQNNPFNVPSEAQELTKSFLQHYYRQYDGGPEARNSLMSLYTQNSIMNFEGVACFGQQKIMGKLLDSPQVQHDQNMAVDVQLVNGIEILLVFLTGQMSIDQTNPMKFSQMFLLQKSGGSYVIGNQIFRLNYG